MWKGLQYWHIPGHREAAFAIVIVPGNPGIGGLYVPFGRALQHTLKSEEGAFPVYCLSYYGFEQPRDFRERPCSLDINEEPDRLRAFLDFVYAKEAKLLIVVGHSVGAWVITKAIGSPSEYSDDGTPYSVAHHVHQIVLLTPFLEVGDNCGNVISTIRAVVRFKLVRDLLTFVTHLALQLLPAFLLRFIVRRSVLGLNTLDTPPEITETLMQTFAVNADYICATMAFAHSEMKSLCVLPGLSGLSENRVYGSALSH